MSPDDLTAAGAAYRSTTDRENAVRAASFTRQNAATADLITAVTEARADGMRRDDIRHALSGNVTSSMADRFYALAGKTGQDRTGQDR